MQTEGVLDASAVLAMFLGEPGAEEVAEWVERRCMSMVNVTEVASKLMRDGASQTECWVRLDNLRMSFLDYDRTIARHATALSHLGWEHGLSLGDRACIATAAYLGLSAVTAEKKWATLELPCKVVCIR